MAISSASSTSSVRRWVAIAQPTTRRLQASSTTAKYRNPDQVGMYVMSATHSRFGPPAVKSRSTRSGAGRAFSLRRVVRIDRRRLTPCKPAARIRRATRLRLTSLPAADRSIRTRGAPYVPRDCLWITAICSVSSALVCLADVNYFCAAATIRLVHPSLLS